VRQSLEKQVSNHHPTAALLQSTLAALQSTGFSLHEQEQDEYLLLA